MAERDVDRRRRQSHIVRHLEDFPRQYAALETAMAAFGDEFDLRRFKQAFETTDDLRAYNQVQAVERALARVQNFVAELAQAGVDLAGLPRRRLAKGGSPAQQAFDALRDARIIDASLCRRLARAQKSRSAIEHGYVQTRAGDVHRAARLVHETARQFIGRYRTWIEDYLAESVR
jgi:uncharacterized protein YutE (UPF0331/DUF86 family)